MEVKVSILIRFEAAPDLFKPIEDEAKVGGRLGLLFRLVTEMAGHKMLSTRLDIVSKLGMVRGDEEFR